LKAFAFQHICCGTPDVFPPFASSVDTPSGVFSSLNLGHLVLARGGFFLWDMSTLTPIRLGALCLT